MKTENPSLNLSKIDSSILDYWEKDNTFKKSLDNRPKSKSWKFYDGPPFSSGLPHYGHLLVGTVKDLMGRYQTMKGFHVERIFGWDTHGLPIEMIIEKKLELKGRTDILEYGIDKYNEACREGVLSYVDQWKVVTDKIGRWVDFENDYKTMDLDFMESVWWVFKQLWDNNRIYESTRAMPYSWRLSTPLSSHEASSNYQDVSDPAVTVIFKCNEIEDTSFIAWTTTAWSLPGNFALCVGKDIEYVSVYDDEKKQNFILAKSRISSYFNEDIKINKTYKGSELLNLTYTPLFNYFDKTEQKSFYILEDDYVSDSDGTGIVSIAPAHGEDDHRIGLKFDLPIIDPTDNEGSFITDVTDFAKLNIKESEKEIVKYLKTNNLLLKLENITHSYPHCERSGTPLMYKTIPAWYVKVSDINEQMCNNNQEIYWVPDHIKKGRFGKWLENARDWNISRNRFWGNPIPLWKCDKCNHIECLGSKKELEEKVNSEITDIHKHFVDKLSWDCTKCTGQMHRTPEVLDCWFESGSMPYAQIHYPFEKKEEFNQHFPADFIIESIDQTRGWFYTLMVLSTSLFKKTPFKNCIVTGMVLAKDGKKMSKSLKNYPDPLVVINKYGADALRLYLINSPLVKGESLKLDENGVKDIVRLVLIPYWNVYSFFTVYANVDNYQPSENLTNPENELDKWIISKFQTLVSQVETEMENLHLFLVVPALLNFIEDLTNWYLRRSRRRFWSKDTKDKQDGYNTLFYILTEFSKTLAPFLPFMTEHIYKNLSKLQENSNSIHLQDYPIKNDNLIDTELENNMNLIRQTVKLGRSLRTRLDIRTRQPLQSLTVVTKNKDDANVLKKYIKHIQEELNIKEVLYSSDESELVKINIKPDFKKLGPIFGKEMKNVASLVSKLNPKQIEKIENNETIIILEKEIASDNFIIVKSSKNKDLEIETLDGVTVFYDTNISQNLKEEGIAREFVNRVQKLRKEADFQVSDRIKITFNANLDLTTAINNFSSYIQEETLCTEFIDIKENNKFDIEENLLIENSEVLIKVVREA